MKRLAPALLLVTLASALTAHAMGFFSRTECTFEGKKLYGRIQLVTQLADVRVQLVDSLADLKVERVNGFAEHCGTWELVTTAPNTRVQLVTSFPDVRVQNVGSLPLR